MKKLLIIIALIATNMGFAAQPETCPPVEIIKAAGLDDVRIEPDHHWVATNKRDSYGTDFFWTLVLGSDGSTVNDIDEARSRAEQSLQTLTFKTGPLHAGNGDTGCFYQAQNIQNVLLINPPLGRYLK